MDRQTEVKDVKLSGMKEKILQRVRKKRSRKIKRQER